MALVEVELVGTWWTHDAPTLRVHSGGGRYVELWSVGAGDSVVVVPPVGQGHDWFAEHLPRLAQTNVVHALDLTGPADPETLRADLVAAVRATGATRVAVPPELRADAEPAARATGAVLLVLDPTDPQLTPEVPA